MLRDLESNGEPMYSSCRIALAEKQLGTDLSEGEVFADLRFGAGSDGLKLENRGAVEKVEE